MAREHARAGRLEIAHELLDEVAATGFQPLPHPGSLNTMLVYTDVAIACDDQPAAAALYEWLVPYADQVAWTNVTPNPPVAHYLGRLATS
jgi:hypothetical protein